MTLTICVFQEKNYYKESISDFGSKNCKDTIFKWSI